MKRPSLQNTHATVSWPQNWCGRELRLEKRSSIPKPVSYVPFKSIVWRAQVYACVPVCLPYACLCKHTWVNTDLCIKQHVCEGQQTASSVGDTLPICLSPLSRLVAGRWASKDSRVSSASHSHTWSTEITDKCPYARLTWVLEIHTQVFQMP